MGSLLPGEAWLPRTCWGDLYCACVCSMVVRASSDLGQSRGLWGLLWEHVQLDKTYASSHTMQLWVLPQTENWGILDCFTGAGQRQAEIFNKGLLGIPRYCRHPWPDREVSPNGDWLLAIWGTAPGDFQEGHGLKSMLVVHDFCLLFRFLSVAFLMCLR